jgi:energy-coupling factor transporter ATP-binding protein EcfA2
MCLGTVPQFSGGRLAGSIDVLGRDPSSTPPRELAALGVGLLFQNPTEGFVAERVVDEVAFGPENLGLGPAEIETRVADALAAVDLSHVADRRGRDLSSGEQQRLALAGVLALRPRLLLLDEPTAHLDETTARLALDLIRRIQHSHFLTLLLTEHRLGIAARLANRVLVLDGGRIVADGPPDAVFADPTLAERGVPVPRATQAGLRLGLKTPPLTADELAERVLAQ